MSSYVWARSPPSIVSHGTTECYIQSFPVQLKLFHVFWYLMDFFPGKKKTFIILPKNVDYSTNSRCNVKKKKLLNYFLIFMFFYFSFNLIFFCWEWLIGTKKTFTWVYFLFSGKKKIFFCISELHDGLVILSFLVFFCPIQDVT